MIKKNKMLILFVMMINLFFSSSFIVPNSYAETTEPQYELYYQNTIILSQFGYVLNNTVYLPCDIIGKNLTNPGITVDSVNSRLSIDMTKENIMLEDPSVTQFVKSYAQTVYIPLKKINNQLFFPLDVVKSFFKVKYNVQDNKVYLSENTGKIKIARINSDSVKIKPSLKDARSENVTLKLNDTVQILKEADNYYQVSLEDGTVCYVKKDKVNITEMNLSSFDFYNTKKKKLTPGKEKISLVWEYVNKDTPTALTSKNDSIDILSPTWFYLNDTAGNVGNKADKAYTDTAHKSGYKVWGCISNNFSTEYTSAMLNNDALMKKAAAEYLFYASLYDLDGINIDFENVNDKDSQGLVNFTALLRQYTEKQGLNLSIDVMIPRAWTIEYDRDALAQYVDYMAVMTYDEHWSTSTISGSVASLPWVEDAIAKTLTEVPSEKVLIGIPLYTRIWSETVVNGQPKVSNTSATMTAVRNLAGQKGLTVTWLDDVKQYYTQYTDGDKVCKIWIEDSRSIANKLNLVQKYNLAGSASWRKGFEENDVWKVYDGMLKQGNSMSSYQGNYN